MADLMSDSTNYDLLVKKYGNFMVPSIKININGVDILNILKASVSQIRVDLSLKEASSASFTIENAYQLATRSFLAKIKAVLMLGSVVSVEFGYGSSRTMVFKGFISEITTEYNDAPSIQVTALDAVRLLMMNRKQNQRYEEKTYAAIVKSVMQKYINLCSNFSNVETSADNLEGVTQNESDFDFLQELAAKANKEFFLFAGDVYFRTPQKKEKEIMTLEWEKSLISFQLRESYCNEKIIAQGLDAKRQVKVEATEVVKSENSFPILLTPLDVVSQHADIVEQEKIQKKAKALKREKENSLKSGSGSCIGLPELVPGRFVYISGINGVGKEKIYLKSVQHSFGESGFTTNFTIGG